MFNKLSRKISMITLSLLSTVTPSFVIADEIELTFEQNGVTIAGLYAGFRENAYVIETETGTLYVPAVLVTCEGANCLNIVVPKAQDG